MKFLIVSEFEKTVELPDEEVNLNDDNKVEFADIEGNTTKEMIERGTELSNKILEQLEEDLKQENIDNRNEFWDSLKIKIIK